MRVVLVGLLLLLGLGCGGNDRPGDEFRVYHLETAIGPPAEAGELRCGPPRRVCPGVVRQPPRHVVRYPVWAEPALTEKDIVRSSVRQKAAAVLIELTADGRRAFAQLTRSAARLGARDQAWHHVAVVVGDEIVAFPEIDYDDYPDGFPDAPAIRFVAASSAEARELVRTLRGE